MSSFKQQKKPRTGNKTTHPSQTIRKNADECCMNCHRITPICGSLAYIASRIWPNQTWNQFLEWLSIEASSWCKASWPSQIHHCKRPWVNLVSRFLFYKHCRDGEQQPVTDHWPPAKMPIYPKEFLQVVACWNILPPKVGSHNDVSKWLVVFFMTWASLP